MRFSCNRSAGRQFISPLIFYVLRFDPLPMVGSAVRLLRLIWRNEIPIVAFIGIAAAFLVGAVRGVPNPSMLRLSASHKDDSHLDILNVDGCSSCDVGKSSYFPRRKSRFLYCSVRPIARALGAGHVNRIISGMFSLILGDGSKNFWGRRMTNLANFVGYRGGWCSYGA